MLCGLLAPSEGELVVAGADVRQASAAARARLGYVAQKFSLYGPLSIVENLEFFASAYGLRGERKRARMDWAIDQFDLGAHARIPSAQLPGGFKQRLAMAAALLHEPEILFLDEPTSGADPLARRVFWRRITALAEQGVTIIVTTHFMQEAEYCDHVAIMDAGQILAQGSPAEVRALARTRRPAEPSMEDAFIAVVEKIARSAAIGGRRAARRGVKRAPCEKRRIQVEFQMPGASKRRRIRALVFKEMHQIVRDPSSIAIGVVLPLILILLFGYGLSLDVKNVPIAIVIEYPTPEAVDLRDRVPTFALLSSRR